MYLALTTDYCDEGSLKDIINISRNTREKIPDGKLEKLAEEMIKSFDWLVREAKVHHRDIKPANIFMHENKIKIGDFNVSKINIDKPIVFKLFIIFLNYFLFYFLYLIFNFIYNFFF